MSRNFWKKNEIFSRTDAGVIFYHSNNLYYERHSPEPNGSERPVLEFLLLFSRP